MYKQLFHLQCYTPTPLHPVTGKELAILWSLKVTVLARVEHFLGATVRHIERNYSLSDYSDAHVITGYM